nr:formyl-CoA transferase [Aureimonas sp. AU4]
MRPLSVSGICSDFPEAEPGQSGMANDPRTHGAIDEAVDDVMSEVARIANDHGEQAQETALKRHDAVRLPAE